MAVTGEKDLQQLKKRLVELAEKAYSRNIYAYTPFLGLAEQQAYYAVEREVSYAGVRMEGGAPCASGRSSASVIRVTRRHFRSRG